MYWSVKAADSNGHLAKVIEGPLDLFILTVELCFKNFTFCEGILRSVQILYPSNGRKL